MPIAKYPNSRALKSPWKWKEEEPEKAYGNFELLLKKTADSRVIDELPYSSREAKTGKHHVRAQVIAERLWLLGYIEGKKTDALALYDKSQEKFLDAVQEFQKESGLKTDRWFGNVTWQTLQQLVAFEGEELPNTWLQSLDMPMALRRAIQLRLSVLGLGTSVPKKKFINFSQPAFGRFQRVLISLGLIPPSSTPFNIDKSVELLMHHDKLLDGLVAISRPNKKSNLEYDFLQPRKWDLEKNRALLSNFVVQLAKIELWLIGAEITLRDEPRYPVFKLITEKNIRNSKSASLRPALKSFYINIMGMDTKKASAAARTLRPDFFVAMHTQEGGVKTRAKWRSESDATKAIIKMVKKQGDVDEALDEGRSLGMKIWDGLKRMWKWFKKKVVRIIEFSKNKFRIFYRYASKGFQIIRRAVRAFIQSSKVLLQGGLLSPSGQSALFISKDMDTRAFIDSRDDLRAAKWLGKRAQLYSSRLLFSAKILATMLSALVNGTLKRWARLAFGLVENLRELTQYYRKIQAAEEELKAISFT